MIKYKKKIIQLYKSGHSGQEIQQELGISLKQVYKILKNSKTPRRTATEQNRLRFEKAPKTYNQ